MFSKRLLLAVAGFMAPQVGAQAFTHVTRFNGSPVKAKSSFKQNRRKQIKTRGKK